MIYFDNAATSYPKPKSVVEAVSNAMLKLGSSGRSAYDLALNTNRMIYATRKKVADLFGYPFPEQVAFTSNVTEALNIAIKGLFSAGQHVITTALEHNSVLRPLYEMEQQGVELTIVSPDAQGRLLPEMLEKELRSNTAGIVCTHVSNLTGYCMDIKAIGNLCKQKGIYFVLDTAQSAGIIPINMRDYHITALCFTGHKSLYGPQGTGGIILRKGIPIRNWKSGGTGIKTFSKTQPNTMPTLLEAGTLNAHGLAGLSAGIDYIKQQGMDTLYQKANACLRKFYDGVSAIDGITIYGDYTQDIRGAVLSLNIAGEDSAYISDILYQDYGICTRSGGHCAPLLHQHFGTVGSGMVRFSFSADNTADEVDIAINAIKNIIKSIQ